MIERCVREHRSSQLPPRFVDPGPGERSGRPGRRRGEIDLDAAVDDLGRQVIFDGQDEIAESVVDAELDRVAKMLACAAPELAFDPHDADVGAAPVGARREIVEVTQERALRTRSWRSL